jgi:hypothetical protein
MLGRKRKVFSQKWKYKLILQEEYMAQGYVEHFKLNLSPRFTAIKGQE